LNALGGRFGRGEQERWLLKPAVFLLASTPATLLIRDALEGRLGANPIEALTFATGDWALRLLLITLALSPLREVSGWSFPPRARRMLGLFALFYALVHFLVYLVLDQFFALDDIVEDILKRPYITVGFTAFVLLIPLGLTSTRRMVRRLGGKRWKRLHRLVYVSAGAAVLHYLWLVKLDWREPLVYGAVWALLMAVRLRRVPGFFSARRAKRGRTGTVPARARRPRPLRPRSAGATARSGPALHRPVLGESE